MAHLFIRIFDFIKRNKFVFYPTLVLFLAGCFYLTTQIVFQEDITKILPKGKDNDITSKVLKQLNFSDKVTVMVSTDSEDETDKLPPLAREFLDSIQQDSMFYTKIQGEISEGDINQTFSFAYDNLPLLLSDEDYRTIEASLNSDSIAKKMRQNYTTLISPTGIVAKDFILKDPLGYSFMALNKLRKLGISKDFELNNGFISTPDKSTILLFITPTYPGTDTKKNEAFVDHLYEVQKQLNKKYDSTASISYFGSPFIALANARQIKSDIQTTVLFSLSILMLILILFYRRIFIPIILFVPAICGGLISLTFMYFIHDSISAISISIGAVLLGITVDYSLHIVTHYREEKNIKKLYKSITRPILTSGITTAAAFLCLLFVNSEVLQDLGLFASISVLFSALSALILVPHLYTPKEGNRKTFLDRLANYKFEKSKILIGCCLLAVGIGIFTFHKAQFNDDISALNFIPKDLKASQKQLESIGSMGSKSIYLSVYADDKNTVLKENFTLESKLENLRDSGLVLDYTTLGSIVLPLAEQQKRIDKWNRFWTQNKIDTTLANVKNQAQKLGFKENTFVTLDQLIQKEYTPLSIEEYDELKALALDEFLSEREGFYTFSSLIKIDSTQRTKVIDRLAGDHILIVDRKHLNEQFLGQMKDDFRSLMNYSFIAVFFILLFFFRRIELAIISIIPIVLTGFVTAGAVYLLDIKLNIFSMIVTTLILGLGIDFSIFMTSGLQKRYTTGEKVLKTYRASIILAAITTILALGVLIFAKHPALKSISIISLVGIISAVLITFVLYPLLFKVAVENRPKKGKSPISLRLFISSVLSFAYYGIGGVLYSILGVIFIPIIPMRKEKKRKWYRKVIAKFIKSVMHSNYGIHNKVRNPTNETFEEPAIIIPNHSSFLDTLSMGFLPTPFIFLVNDWVYNSPIFGKAVQLAGYYPISQGLENGEEELVKMIKKGYSLIVFPEGTRSKNGKVGRFHKGAFLMAQKYNIDIVPLYIHGNAHLLPKGDFIIYDGLHTHEIGQRIPFGEKEKERSLKDLTKEISYSFRNRFKEIRKELEPVDYFKQKIRLNFLYKSREVVQLAQKEYKNNKSFYHSLNKELGEKEKIFRVGGDLGIGDHLIVLQEGNRSIDTFINSIDNLNVAVQSYLIKKRKIHYVNDLKTPFKTLLLTIPLEEEMLKEIVENNSFDKIILLKNTVEPNRIFNFGYQIEKEELYYYTLKKGNSGQEI